MIGRIDFNLDEDEDLDDCSTNNAVLLELLDLPTEKDGPEIFKRVQVLTRWEDRRESRGPLFCKRSNGDYFVWIAAGDDGTKMRQELRDILQSQVHWILAGCTSPGVGYWVQFIGKSIANSRPVIFLAAVEKKARRRLLKATQQIDWVRQNPRILVLLCPFVRQSWEFQQRVGGLLQETGEFEMQ